MRLDFGDGFVRVGGYRLYHKSIGEAAKGTILCLHGGPGSNHWVAINMADLAAYGYKVVWYDQLGCGKSEEPASNSEYTIKNAADEAEGVREALGLGTCHLWGYSYGGALALQTILSHPRGFRSLVVSSGFASLEEHYSEMRRLVGTMPPNVRRVIREYEAKNEMDDPEYQKAAAIFVREHISDLSVQPYGIAVAQTWMNPRVATAMYGEPDGFTTTPNGSMASWNVTKELRRIRVPALVTVGARDHVTPSCARTIQTGIAGSRLVVFRGCGHDAMQKKRDLYLKTVLDFYESIEAPRPDESSKRRG